MAALAKPARSSTAIVTASLAGMVALLAVGSTRASAGPTEASVAQQRGATDRVHEIASFGAAIGGIGGYEGYGIGLLARAGAEVPLFHAAGTRHALLIAVEAGRFSAWVETPFLFRGVQLDLASLRADWRLYPWRGRGLFVDAGAGFLVARDRIAMTLPTRTVSSTERRLGVPIELATGWLIANHFDVSLRYSQMVFTDKAPASFGFMQLALGVRL